MKRLVLTRTAHKDLIAIWSYIAADNLDAADRLVEELRKVFRR